MISKRVFLDYASTTPVDPKVFEKMKPFFTKDFYNAQAIYQEGNEVKKKVNEARKVVARIGGVKENEVIFTASGTESNNLAITGVIKAFKNKYPNRLAKIITTKTEHISVLAPIEEISKYGVQIIYLEPDQKGFISPDDLAKNLDQDVVLVSVILANNEIGTILPLRKYASEIVKYKNKENLTESDYPYLHTDASQAPCFMDIQLHRLGADLLTLDGSKIYGPKGVGVLFCKNYVDLLPVMHGGSQESGLRPGTENPALIVGFAEALKIAHENYEKETKRLKDLQIYFVKNLLEISEKIVINGSMENRLPNNVNICIEGLDAEFAVIQMDQLGVACSSATTCRSISEITRSYVVDSLGLNCGASSLRFTLGRATKKSDLDLALKALKQVLKKQKIC